VLAVDHQQADMFGSPGTCAHFDQLPGRDGAFLCPEWDATCDATELQGQRRGGLRPAMQSSL